MDIREMLKYNIGNTPLRMATRINDNQIFVKSEFENFGGSIKARSGYYMIHELPKSARDKKIIESTSGNLGLALGFFCKEYGLDFTALIDASTAAAKVERMKKAGIKYILAEKEKGYDYRSSRIRLAERLEKTGDYYWINQYDNADNVAVHELTTAAEIWEQSGKKVTHIICAMGSCGTICGIGRFFCKNSPNVKIIGVEPEGSTIFGKKKGDYINAGAGLVGKPGNLLKNPDVIDEAYTVSDLQSLAAARELNERYHIRAGVTAGMAFHQALELAEKLRGAYIVIVAADGRESYNEYL